MNFFRNVEKNYRRPGRGRLFLIALDHAVADAGFGEDVGGLGGVFFDLAADVGHVDAEDLVVAAGAGAPELLDEIVVGQDLARVQAEEGDELVLVLGEAGVAAGDVDAVLAVVDGEVGSGEDAGIGYGGWGPWTTRGRCGGWSCRPCRAGRGRG